MKLEEKDIDRFWSKVDVKGPNDCWEWTTTLYVDGYGQFMINKTSRRAHRISYQLANNTIPNKMVVMHTCDNRKCVNPSHLKLGTQKDNIHDMMNKGRKPKIHRQGTLNGRAVLDENAIKFIRQHGIKGRGGNVAELANKFNISSTQILGIISNKFWKHVK